MTKEQSKAPINIVGAIDDIHRDAGYGGRSTQYAETARGFDIYNRGQTVIPSRSATGLVFFTRPLLNLTYGNLSLDNTFLPWRDAPPESILRMTRVFLDPINQTKQDSYLKDKDGIYTKSLDIERVTSPMVDPYNPFIPLLSNRLLSLSGWPDVRMDHYASDAGLRGEQWIMADGIGEVNGAFTLDSTFSNREGDDIYILFDLYLKYIYRVTVGDIRPYAKMIAMRMLDYMMRAYSFTLDGTMKYITHYACTGAMFPTNLPSGIPHNYDYQENIKSGLDQISISWQCTGARYNDNRILLDFNKLVGMFNRDLELIPDRHPSFKGKKVKTITDNGEDNIPLGNNGNNDSKDARWIKLTHAEKRAANLHAYPLINMVTKELEWWVHRNDYIKYVLKRVDYVSPGSGDVSRVSNYVGNDTGDYAGDYVGNYVGNVKTAHKPGVITNDVKLSDPVASLLKK